MDISQKYIKVIFGLKLKQLRVQKNLSLNQLSEKCGLSASYLNEIESGKKYPKGDKVILISKALDISYDKLISLKLTKQLAPIGELFESKIFEKLPLDHYGIDVQKFISLMSKASLQLSALVSTIIEMGKNTEQSENNFSRSAIRTYKEFSENYFEDLEQSVEEFINENKINPRTKNLNSELLKILTEKYFYKIDSEVISNYPELISHRAFVKKGKEKKLYLNKNLSLSQKNFIIAKELAYNFLKLNSRSYSHSSKRLENFDHLLNNLKASYFATALIINKNLLIKDLQEIFSKKNWDEKYFIKLIEKYSATPEMLFQRICNLLSKYFGINKFFFYRFTTDNKGDLFKLSKEIRLNVSREPGGLKNSEHYCRRWVSIKILKKLITESKINTESDLILSDILHSKFYNSESEFLSISISKQNKFIPSEFYSVTLGFEFDSKLKEKISFCDDTKIPIEIVNDTCEMCPIKDCSVRVAEPIELKKIEQEKRIEKILSDLNN